MKTKVELSKDRFKALPDDVVWEIYKKLPPNDQMSLTYKIEPPNRHSLFAPNLENELRLDLLIDKFIYLVSRKGENNIKAVKAMLKQYPHLISKLIGNKKQVHDAAGRLFKKRMSAYGYVVWSGNAEMRSILQEFVGQDETLIDNLYQESKIILKQGVDFEYVIDGLPIPNSKVSASKHFDCKPLINAYNNYLMAAGLLLTGTLTKAVATQLNKIWLAVGQEQAKVPIAYAQKKCVVNAPAAESDVTTVLIYTPDQSQYWFAEGRPHPQLGVTFAICGGLVVSEHPMTVNAINDRDDLIAFEKDILADQKKVLSDLTFLKDNLRNNVIYT